MGRNNNDFKGAFEDPGDPADNPYAKLSKAEYKKLIESTTTKDDEPKTKNDKIAKDWGYEGGDQNDY